MPTRDTFDRSLNQLQDEILVLGSMVDEAILDSVDALNRRDHQAAQQIYLNDQKINEKRYSIENECLTLIATQQPMARDLRLLAAVLEINTELERMGDYAKGIAHINLLLEDEPVEVPISELHRMAELGLGMLHRALSAFIARDAAAARKIPEADEEIDALYYKIFQDTMQRMIADPSALDRLNYMIWAAHNLERMADRVTNICERIIFVTTGQIQELDQSDSQFVD
ncbi:MAG: phosphate signaling complex protein PhoU [Anaerolineales bacterium]|jgi:phosphate transport system protein